MKVINHNRRVGEHLLCHTDAPIPHVSTDGGDAGANVSQYGVQPSDERHPQPISQHRQEV
jgi:hypothetical protein